MPATEKVEARLLSKDARVRPVLLAASFVIAVCLSILAIEAWQLVTARNVEIAESETAATNLAKSLAEHASNVMIQADVLLSGIVERLETDGMGPASVDRIHRLLHNEKTRLGQLQRLSVMDARGYTVTTDLNQPLDRSVPHADREYFVHHQTHDDVAPHLGPPIRSRSSDQWIITISRRFNTLDGRFGGIVLASIDLDFFNAYYRQFEIGRNGTIVLAMSDGTILDRRPFKENLIGSSISNGPLFRSHIAFDEVGTAWIRSTIDGVERLTAFRKLNVFPAYAIVALSKEEMLQDWANDSIVHVAAALLLVAILALIGWKLVSQVAQRHADQLLVLQSRRELQSLNAQLDSLARVDGLTGLSNRRDFDRVLDEEVRRFRRSGGSLALIMLDIDRFKAYNDHFGHPQGDECIRMVAARIKDCVSRPGDICARYGGEEFVVLLPSTDAGGALVVAEQIRQSIDRCAMPHPMGPRKLVTVSMGIGVFTAGEAGGSTEALLVRADQALYAAKETGRDAIRVQADHRSPVAGTDRSPAFATDVAAEEA